MTSVEPASFLSGDAGDVTDPWRRAKRTAGELAFGALDTLTATRLRAARLARATPPRDVLVIGVYRPGSSMPDALHPLHSTTHNVRIALGSLADADAALREHTLAENLSRRQVREPEPAARGRDRPAGGRFGVVRRRLGARR